MASKWQGAEEALKLTLSQHPNLDVDKFLGKRCEWEDFWVEIYPFLLSRGYRLRPRYDPDWVPSWSMEKGPTRHLTMFEDSVPLMLHTHVNDAVCMRSGQRVVLKRVDKSTEEIPLSHYLTSHKLISDPRNHCVPILDIIPLPNDDTKALMVMPLLLHFDKFPFRRVGEFAEAMRQFLEGLEFMHEHKIAHRDACYFNLMMDGSKVVPKGFHFVHPRTHDGIMFSPFEWRERWSVKPNKYYLIDFDLSRMYDTNVDMEMNIGRIGQDRSVPEFAHPVPYDPFKLDVYQLGNALLQVVEKYEGLEPFRPWLEQMTNTKPKDRPSPSAVLRQLDGFTQRMLKRHIWKPSDSLYDRFLIMLGKNSTL